MKVAWFALLFASSLMGQNLMAPSHDLRVSIGPTMLRGNSPPGTCGCFYIVGGALEAGLETWHHIEAAIEVGGNHASRVGNTGRDLSLITLMAGPRARQSVGPLMLTEHVFAGAVRGFDAQFGATDTATAPAFSVGAGTELRLSRNTWLRPVEVNLVQLNLPNGAENRQRDLRLGMAFVMRFRTTSWHR